MYLKDDQTLRFKMVVKDGLILYSILKGKTMGEQRPGRTPPSARYNRALLRTVKKNPRVTTAELGREAGVSPRSVAIHLRKLGYYCRAAKRKPLLRDFHVKKR